MKRSLCIASLALLLAAPALAEPVESCCACVAATPWQPSGPTNPMLEPAFFCRLVTSPGEEQAFGAQCDARNGIGICVAQLANAAQDNLDCPALLAEEAMIACPVAKPVPVGGRPLLVGLAAGLAAVGGWAARRRARR